MKSLAFVVETGKSSLVLLLAAAVLSACSGSAPEPEALAPSSVATNTQSASEDAARADAKAIAALSTLGSVLRDRRPGARYELKEAFPLYAVAATELAARGAAEPVDALLRESVDRVYPVLDGVEVVSSITLHKQNGEWDVAVIGEGGGSSDLVSARASLRDAHAADDDAYALVKVVGMNERYLTHRNGGVAFLTSLRGDGARIPRPAMTVLAELAARARGEK